MATRAESAHAEGRTKYSRWRALLQSNGIWAAVIAILCVTGLLSPETISWNHFANVLQVASFVGMAALGQTAVILTGGLDLSVGGVITLVNIVAATMMNGEPGTALYAVLFSLLLGTLIGVANGLFVTRLNITPLIATLGMNSILFGAALVYTRGAPRGSMAPGFTAFGQAKFLSVPALAWVWLLTAVLLAVAFTHTPYGRRLYASGANPRAAWMTGVPVDRIKVIAYGLCGLTAAATGLLLSAYIGLPSLGIGDIYMLNTVAAVVVGGTALTGGKGTVWGSVGGALFITLLNSLTNVLRLSVGTQYIIRGVIIAAGIAFYTRIRERQSR